MRFPFTFMGLIALALGVWAAVYLLAHRSLDSGSQGLVGGTALLCIGFGVYVVVRRVRQGPQH